MEVQIFRYLGGDIWGHRRYGHPHKDLLSHPPQKLGQEYLFRGRVRQVGILGRYQRFELSLNCYSKQPRGRHLFLALHRILFLRRNETSKELGRLLHQELRRSE